MKLFDRIMQLRVTASAIYDKAVMAKVPDQEIQALINPISLKMSETIQHSHTAHIVEAIHMIDSQAKGFENTISYLANKINEERYHADVLRSEIGQRMAKEGVTEMVAGGYTLTLVDGKTLIIR